MAAAFISMAAVAPCWATNTIHDNRAQNNGGGVYTPAVWSSAPALWPKIMPAPRPGTVYGTATIRHTLRWQNDYAGGAAVLR